MRSTKMLVLCGALLFTSSAVAAQQARKSQHPDRPRTGAFGFSYVTYEFVPDDGVFTDNRSHASQNFGFRFNRSFRRAQPVGWMLDGELYLSYIDRELLNVPLPETVFGLHAFVGPQITRGRFTFSAGAGVNRTSVPETELVSASRGSVITYVGRGGLSRLWAANLNALTANNQPTVQARIPAYAKVAPAGLLGFAYDFGGKGPLGFRLSAEVLPVFASPTRANFRTSLSITG